MLETAGVLESPSGTDFVVGSDGYVPPGMTNSGRVSVFRLGSFLVLRSGSRRVIRLFPVLDDNSLVGKEKRTDRPGNDIGGESRTELVHVSH